MSILQPSNKASASEPTDANVNRLRELVLILCIVVLVAAACSHLAIKLLKIKTSWGGYQPYGVSGQKVSTFLFGSSLAYSGIDWHKVSDALGEPIVSWASTGSTPSEWEQMHRRSANASRSFIVFAAADLNEYSLCDFRAEIVPLSRTVVDLWQMKADWPYIKMVLSQYPVTAVRMFFPTVGRSDGVMTGIRDELKNIIATGNRTEAGEAFRVGPDGNMAQEERVSD